MVSAVVGVIGRSGNCELGLGGVDDGSGAPGRGRGAVQAVLDHAYGADAGIIGRQGDGHGAVVQLVGALSVTVGPVVSMRTVRLPVSLARPLLSMAWY